MAARKPAAQRGVAAVPPRPTHPMPPLPGGLQARADGGWVWTQTSGDKTIAEVKAKEFAQQSDPPRVDLKFVEVKVFHKDDSAYDLIQSDKAELRTEDGVMFADGEVNMTMGFKADPNAKNRLVHIKTSGVTYSTQTGKVNTDRKAEFEFENSRGSALGATYDPALRELARTLAGRLMLDVGNRGRTRPRGVGKLVEQAYRPDAGDIDIDASLDALAESRRRIAPDPERLRVRGWRKPGTALCLLIDRSGSMGGEPLATSAVAVAAVAGRNPDDWSVVAFGKDVIVTKSQDVPKSPEHVINDVLTLRGFGTTDLAGALVVAQGQLARSRAGRRVAVLLSDCRATVEGDPVAAAAGLDELVVVAPRDDCDEAREFAARTGARLALVDGPMSIPAALAEALETL